MTPRQKTIVLLGAFAVVLLLFVAFVLLPLLRGIRSDSTRVFAARQELNRVNLYEEQIQKFEELSQTREQDIARFQGLFVDRHTPIAFIESLEKYSGSSQVSLKITPVESLKKEKDAWESIDFELTGRGSFPHVLSFVKQLENAPYLLEFKNAVLQRLATGEVDFSLLMKVYTK